MIKFIANHPISIPLTKILDPPLPLHHLHRAFTSIRLVIGVLETTIIGDRILPIYKSTFLKAIGMKANPKGFKVIEPTSKEFQTFLNYIGYTQDNKDKDFKKSAISGLWTALMHLIIQGLSGKLVGTYTLSKDWLNIGFSIYSGQENAVDLPEVLWHDFCKFATKRKPKKISSPRFWALKTNIHRTFRTSSGQGSKKLAMAPPWRATTPRLAPAAKLCQNAALTHTCV